MEDGGVQVIHGDSTDEEMPQLKPTVPEVREEPKEKPKGRRARSTDSTRAVVNESALTWPPPLRVGFRVGDSVRIQGLINKADMNGAEGVIESWNHAVQRWTLTMKTGEFVGGRKAIRPENLLLIRQVAGRDTASDPPDQ